MVSNHSNQACHHFEYPNHSVTLDGGVIRPNNMTLSTCPNNMSRSFVLTIWEITSPNNMDKSVKRPNNMTKVKLSKQYGV